MSLIKIEHIRKDTRYGLWRIEEDESYFLKQLPPGMMAGYDAARFSERRKKEFLASRLLIKNLTDNNIELELQDNGKVIARGDSYYLSLSHFGKVAAAMVSENFPVGIDVEEIHPRVMKVMHKFLNEQEAERLGTSPELWKVVLCWSAKESVYKLVNRPGLAFKDIYLNVPNSPVGSFEAEVKSKEFHKQITIFCEKPDNYMLTYCIDKTSV